MKTPKLSFHGVLLSGLLMVSGAALAPAPPASPPTEPSPRTFAVQGVVQALAADGRSVVIRHEAIPGYMEAMTMPFETSEPAQLEKLKCGDEISFRLNVTETESWIDRIAKTGTARLSKAGLPEASLPKAAQGQSGGHPLLDFKFTNQLGQAVSLGDFRGQALAITFFFTRCPIPEYCPRLTKNFQEASQRLGAMPAAPTNWHFLSVSFDPAMDTPPVLKAYGERYHYDPARWSFLTGPADKIYELARLSGVEIAGEAGFFNHTFCTLIIDAAGRLQTTFPVGGDLSDVIVGEMLKAAAASNPSVPRDPGGGSSLPTPRIAPGQAVQPGKP
jgi:protein SCO1